MQGKIIAEGLLRAEDGKRYSFELSDIENIGSYENLVNLEVDFEPNGDRAKSIYILVKNSQNSEKIDENITQSSKKTKNQKENHSKKLLYFLGFMAILAAIVFARYIYTSKSADTYFKGGDYNNAIILYEKSCKNNNKQDCKNLAQAYFETADYKKAIELYKEFCNENTKDKESCKMLAQSYLKNNSIADFTLVASQVCSDFDDLGACEATAVVLEEIKNEPKVKDILYTLYSKICSISGDKNACNKKEKLYNELYKKPEEQKQVSQLDANELQKRFSKAAGIIENDYRYNDYANKFLSTLMKFSEARVDVIKTFGISQGEIIQHFVDIVNFLELVAYKKEQKIPPVSQYETAEFYDARLTIAYKKIRTVLDKEQKQRFKDNEIAWINFKLAQRDFADSLGYDGNEFIRLANKDQMELLEAICRKLGL